jgi:hypothetical protein
VKIKDCVRDAMVLEFDFLDVVGGKVNGSC